MRTWVGMGATVAAAFGASQALAATLYDTVDAPTFSSEQIGSGSGYEADSFSTSSAGFDLTRVSLTLRGDVAPSAGHVVTVALLADAPNTPDPIDPYPSYPGATIATLGGFAGAALAPGDAVYTLNVSAMLAPDTRYWIALTSNDGTYTGWDYAAGPAGLLGAEYAYDGQSGGSQVNQSYFYQLKLSNGAVPEPTSWALTIAGVGLTGWSLRRRHRRRGSGKTTTKHAASPRAAA